jgi:hypothetical protein
MSRASRKHERTLTGKYPPSEPCSCEVCLGYCRRPGWWTVQQAASALHAGYGPRMMLEIAPERGLGVLAPAFYGCEGTFAFQKYAARGCNFLKDARCELHGTPYQPLECRCCHHDRPGLGPLCHADLERDWNAPSGRLLVGRWVRQRRLGADLARYGLERLKV